jgi:ubiquinone biosynthesis monooxygenase Coq7
MRDHPDVMIDSDDTHLSEKDRKHIISLMRVNHSGEICAQALYHGQALTARDQEIKEALCYASQEETDHLAWTQHRINELGGKTSVLNPVWYMGSLGIGVVAGLMGDRWNLGFLEETEKQVGLHLQNHLEQIPEKDHKSKAILLQMAKDEEQHEKTAHSYGAAPLPLPVKESMKYVSQVMTRLSYWI